MSTSSPTDSKLGEECNDGVCPAQVTVCSVQEDASSPLADENDHADQTADEADSGDVDGDADGEGEAEGEADDDDDDDEEDDEEDDEGSVGSIKDFVVATEDEDSQDDEDDDDDDDDDDEGDESAAKADGAGGSASANGGVAGTGKKRSRDVADDGIDPSNIVTGKRRSKPTVRYVHPDMSAMYLSDIPREEIAAALEEPVSSTEDNDVPAELDPDAEDEEYQQDDDEDEEDDDIDDDEDDDEEEDDDDAENDDDNDEEGDDDKPKKKAKVAGAGDV